MQTLARSYGQKNYGVLPRPFVGPQSARGYIDAEGAVLDAEQEERAANSKLERLAEELRALGIQF